MTIVYRLEAECGYGVYASDAAGGVMEHDPIHHPLPDRDTLLVKNLEGRSICGYHFGFASLDQLRAWFYNDQWLRSISEYGIVLSVYDSEEVYIGNTQAVFHRGDLNPVERYDIKEFFKL